MMPDYDDVVFSIVKKRRCLSLHDLKKECSLRHVWRREMDESLTRLGNDHKVKVTSVGDRLYIHMPGAKLPPLYRYKVDPEEIGLFTDGFGEPEAECVNDGE